MIEQSVPISAVSSFTLLSIKMKQVDFFLLFIEQLQFYLMHTWESIIGCPTIICSLRNIQFSNFFFNWEIEQRK